MDLPPVTGIILKTGVSSSSSRIREFHFERRAGAPAIVYKTHKLLAKFADAAVRLERNFFIQRVRSATELESTQVQSFAKTNTVFSALEAKRCFDVDVFDPNFPPAVGPTKLKSFTVFATPDSAIGDLWSFLSGLMIEQGVFAPSPEDPDQFVVVNVTQRRLSASGVVAVADERATVANSKAKISSVDAEMLLSSLPLPPATELIDMNDMDI